MPETQVVGYSGLRDPRPADLGSMIHKVLYHYEEGDVDIQDVDNPEVSQLMASFMDGEARNLLGLEPEDALPESWIEPVRTKLIPSLRGYADYVAFEGLDVMSTDNMFEREIKMKVPGRKIDIVGHVDNCYKLVNYESNPWVVRDFKTGASHAEVRANDNQMAMYATIMTSNGEPVGRVEYVSIKINQRTSRSKPPFFVYSHYPVTKLLLKNTRRMMIDQAKQIGDLVDKQFVKSMKRSVRNTGPVCKMYCRVQDHCAGTDSSNNYWEDFRGTTVREQMIEAERQWEQRKHEQAEEAREIREQQRQEQELRQEV